MEYHYLHKWINRNWGKADRCENTECTAVNPKRHEWSLLKGRKYSQIREDYRMLCPSCHSKYDRTEDGNRRISLFHKGKPKSPEHRRNISLGNKGKPKSPEHIVAMEKSGTWFKKGHVPWAKGKIVPEERRKRISESLKRYNSLLRQNQL